MLKQLRQMLFRPSDPKMIRVGGEQFEASLLVPVIKGTGLVKTGHDKIYMVGEPWEMLPLGFDLTGDLAVLLAINLPRTLHFLSNASALDSGLAAVDLLELAKKNLAKLSLTIRITEDGPIGFRIQLDGNLDASLLLYDDLWDQFEKLVGGTPLVVIPHRSMLFGCCAETEGAADYLLSKVRDFDPNVRHVVSKNLFVRQDRAWRLYTN